MQLTAYSDFALRVLLYLAARQSDGAARLASIDEIATAYGISKNHLMKVVHELSRRGWIETVRGRGGGMRLAMPARAIHIGAVYRDVEPITFGSRASGKRTPAVRALHDVVDEAIAKFLATLDRYTLADLVRAQEITSLEQRLGAKVISRGAKKSAAKVVARRARKKRSRATAPRGSRPSTRSRRRTESRRTT